MCFQQTVLWDKASLVSANETRQFYVRELWPFVRISSIGRERDALQQQNVVEARDETNTNNITLYGSTQLAVDLAELAAEVGNETLAVDDGRSAACSQTIIVKESNNALVKTDEHSEEKILPANAPIALDGFCLHSCSVSFVCLSTTVCRITLAVVCIFLNTSHAIKCHFCLVWGWVLWRFWCCVTFMVVFSFGLLLLKFFHEDFFLLEVSGSQSSIRNY